MRMVTDMEEKRSHRKACVLFTVHISSDKWKGDEDDEVLKRYLIF